MIIDAGLAQASDATIAMELGCDGVLVNTAIAKAKKPFEMALAFKNAVIAGRQCYKSGRIDKILMGNPSSPSKLYALPDSPFRSAASVAPFTVPSFPLPLSSFALPLNG